MPNWCDNELEISGPEEDLKAFLEKAHGEGENIFSLQALVPCPKELHDAVSGSPEECYEAVYGKLSHFDGCVWIPDEAKGSREALIAFLVKERYESEENLRAIADKYKFNIDTYGYRSWYEWCRANWGTKWDIDQTHLIYQEASAIKISFDTAWGPPDNAIYKIAKMFPTLAFRLEYFEAGMCFYGRIVLNTVDEDDDYCEHFSSSADLPDGHFGKGRLEDWEAESAEQEESNGST